MTTYMARSSALWWFGLLTCVVVDLTLLPSRGFGASRQSSTAIVRGELRDSSDAVVAGATVMLTGVDTGRERSASTSDETGTFRFVALPPGRYLLIATLEGFEPIEREILLTVDQDLRVTLTLTPRREVHSVEVRAGDTSPIEPLKTSLGSTITRRNLDESPIPFGVPRNFATLAMLTPGVQNDLAATSGNMGTAGQIGSQTYLLDGLSIDLSNGELVATPPLEAIQEFKVVTNHFSAEFGQASGAVVSVVTRSGSNSASGRLFWLHQDGEWNATSAKAKLAGTSDPGLTQEALGGSWSGPIVPNHAFVFGTVEQVRRQTVYINTSPVRPLFRPADPLTVPFQVQLPRALLRTDMNLTPLNVLTFRYFYSGIVNGNAGREPQSTAERSRVLHNPVHEAGIADTHVFRSGAVNEVRAHWERYRWIWTVDGFCPNCAALNYPSIKLGKPTGAPSSERRDRGDLADTVTWLTKGPAGRHEFKTGFSVSYVRLADSTLPNMTGTYRFPLDIPFAPGDAASYPNLFTQNVGNPSVPVHETIASAFVQDGWHPADRVSLDLGVRWDHTRWPGPSSRRDDVAPRAGISIDPWKRGTTVFRAGFGRYYDESGLQIARTAATNATVTITNPGFQGDAVHFDPYGFSPRRVGPAVPFFSVGEFGATATPYTDQASIGVQQQVGQQIGLTIDLVRALGRRLPIAHDVNYPNLANGARPDPDPTLKQIVATETRGASWYTGLQIGVRQRPTKHYSYSLAYTWSSAENNTDGAGTFPQDQTASLAAERGPTLLDARHQFAAGGTLNGPLALRLSTVVYARSALPYNITTGADTNKDDVFNDRPAGVGRNSGRGSGLFEADVRVSRPFQFHKTRVEVFVEAFNVTNHVNWTSYNGSKAAREFFGQPTDAGIPRQLQLGVRLDFGAGRQ